MGFAAETTDSRRPGASKLGRKDAGPHRGERGGRQGTGFGSDTNEAMILGADGDDEPLRTWTKTELAGGHLRPDRARWPDVVTGRVRDGS